MASVDVKWGSCGKRQIFAFVGIIERSETIMSMHRQMLDLVGCSCPQLITHVFVGQMKLSNLNITIPKDLWESSTCPQLKSLTFSCWSPLYMHLTQATEGNIFLVVNARDVEYERNEVLLVVC